LSQQAHRRRNYHSLLKAGDHSRRGRALAGATIDETNWQGERYFPPVANPLMRAGVVVEIAL
jgi:hypothetical protein